MTHFQWEPEVGDAINAGTIVIEGWRTSWPEGWPCALAGFNPTRARCVRQAIFVRRSIWKGEEVSGKTKRGYRVVNIEPGLVQMLASHVGDRRGGRVFHTRNGTPFCKNNVNRKLKQILKKLNLAPAGLHAFRHGRVSVLQANGVPGDLVTEWVGHSNLRTTSRYTHFRDDFRKQVASNVGLFTQKTVAADLQFSPNSPKSVLVAAEADAA